MPRLVRLVPVAIALAAAALTPALALAQSVQVNVSSRSIEEGDAVQVAFDFQGDGDPRIPNLENDWDILRRQQQVSASFGFGRQTMSKVIKLVLQPKRTGKLRIPSAELVNNGAVLARSNAFDIMVRPVKTLKPSEARLPANLSADDLVVVPELTRDRYYVGEPIVVRYKLYAARMPGGLDVPEFKVPDGVQRKDLLEGRYQPDDGARRLQGRQYRTITVFEEVWRVLRPDVIRIPQIRVDVRTGRFSGLTTVKAPPLELVVDAPPNDGRPAEYRAGAIGEFSITAKIRPDQGGGRALLEVRIDGSGSLPTIEAPDIEGVTGAEVQSLPSDDQDLIQADGTGMHGRRVFQYLLTPTRTGTVFVPPITFAFFNPKTGQYQTTQTKQQTWVAKEAIGSTRKTVGRASGQDEERVELHPIESESELVTVTRTPLFARTWFLVLMALPLLGFLAVEGRAFASRRAQNVSGKVKVRRAFKKASKLVDDAVASGKSQPVEVYGGLARAISGYLADRFDLSVGGMTRPELRQALLARGASDAVAGEVLGVLEVCDMARFAPGASDASEISRAVDRTRAALTELEKLA